MRIGLVRHFPVNYPWPSGWLTAAELEAWRMNYESSGVHVFPADMGGHAWGRCFSSDAERAYVTAKAVYAGKVIKTPLLREIDFGILRMGRLRLPYCGWRWVVWSAWVMGHRSQRVAKEDVLKRIRAMADMVEAEDQDTLLISHAGTMALLRQELNRRNFSGPKFRTAEHGRLYVFECQKLNTRRQAALAP